MEIQETIITKGKERLKQMKMFAEELEVQLALGKAEARDMFEKERKNFAKYINQQKAVLREEEKASQAHKLDLAEKFEALEEQLEAEVPTNKRSYDSYKKKVLESIYGVEGSMKDNYGEVEKSLQYMLDQFKAKLDGYRIQVALSDLSNKEEAVGRKEELKEMVENIQQKLRSEEEGEEKMKNFIDEVSQSFDHLKKAFGDLFA